MIESAEGGAKATIRELYPGLTEEQMSEVEESLHNYAAIVWRVCARIEREQGGFDETGAPQ